MKKTLAVLLVLCLAFSAVWANGDGEKGSTSGGIMPNAPGTLPLVDETVTLSAFIATRPGVDSFEYEDNWFTKWMEDRTNVHIDWTVGVGDDAKQKLNLLMASGDYTDMVLNQWAFSGSEMIEYGTQGILMPLNDLIDEYGLYTKQFMAEFPDFEKLFTMPDGNIYSLAGITQCYHCRSTGKMWIYTPWLDQLGLDMPQTTDEFYQVLKAFKEQDPNGNGMADEIALAGAAKGWEAKADIFLMNAFAYNDNGNRAYLSGDKVMYSPTSDAWKNGLKYMKKLYDEGLLLPESFTQDNKQLKRIGENPGDHILGVAPGGAPGVFADLSNIESGRWLDYKTVPPLEGPDGFRAAKYNPYPAITSSFVITDACETPEVAFAWGDLFYDEEVYMNKTYGEKEVYWRWAKDGEKGADGQQGVWAELVADSQKPVNIRWNNVNLPYWNPAENHTGRVSESPGERVLWEETKMKYEPYQKKELVVPPLIFTRAQSKELADIEASAKNYVNEMLARFVIGESDIDAEWDAYLDQLDKMNVSRMIEIYQEAYDAQYSN